MRALWRPDAQPPVLLEKLRRLRAQQRASLRSSVRAFILADQGGCCALCGMAPEWQGAPLVFVLDHVDGNSSDNSRVNVRLICPNCDSRLPTYTARNRGNGRHARRIRYANGQSF